MSPTAVLRDRSCNLYFTAGAGVGVGTGGETRVLRSTTTRALPPEKGVEPMCWLDPEPGALIVHDEPGL